MMAGAVHQTPQSGIMQG
jgi:hypothetical protein